MALTPVRMVSPDSSEPTLGYNRGHLYRWFSVTTLAAVFLAT